MANNIKLNSKHLEAKRLTFFLNAVEEQLTEVPFNWNSWNLLVDGAFKFVSKGGQPVSITVLFCDSYHDPIALAKANKLSVSPTAKWGQNGIIMYFVESKNEDKVSSIFSLFAGQE
jgi:hypothetical protein